jgi:hypothetical protein
MEYKFKEVPHLGKKVPIFLFASTSIQYLLINPKPTDECYITLHIVLSLFGHFFSMHRLEY